MWRNGFIEINEVDFLLFVRMHAEREREKTEEDLLTFHHRIFCVYLSLKGLGDQIRPHLPNFI